jgi:hypothetical protein
MYIWFGGLLIKPPFKPYTRIEFFDIQQLKSIIR